MASETIKFSSPKDEKKDRPSLAPRMPTLEALAARIIPKDGSPPNVSSSTANASATNPLATSQSSSGSSRLRLNPSVLSRTNSSQSPPTQQPRSDSSSPPPSEKDSAISPPSKVLTTSPIPGSSISPDKDKDTEQPRETRERAPSRGYKNVPSLDAISERMAMVRARSGNTPEGLSLAALSLGSEKNTPPQAPTPEGEPVPQIQTEDEGKKEEISEEHPLQHPWTLFHDTKSQRGGVPGSADPTQTTHGYIPPPSTESGAYEAGLTVVGEFTTVEGFCRYFNWLKAPSLLDKNSNYHLFKDGIKPMWEDPANATGGKWVITMRANPELLDRCWSWLAMALVGEELDERDEICGAVVSVRAKIDRIQLWIRSKDDVERINGIGKKLVKLLDLGDEQSIGLEFQYNTDDRVPANKFISIVPPQPSYHRSTPTTASGQNFPTQTPPTPPFPTNPGWRGGARGGGIGGGGGIGRGSSFGFTGGAMGSFGGGGDGSVSRGHSRNSSASGTAGSAYPSQ